MILHPPFDSFFHIKIYSICMLCAILFSYFAMLYFAKKFFLSDKDIIYNFYPPLIIVSVVFARLYYVLIKSDFYFSHPIEILKIYNGGIAIHGAIIGGILFGYVYCKIKKLEFFKYADLTALVLPLGQAIGRWGNFFNQEAFAKPVISSNVPFKLYIDPILRPIEYLNYEYFHPAFLYESLLDFLLFFVLFYILNKTRNKFQGLIFFSYILFYSLIRAFIEPIRLDSAAYFLNLPLPFIVSLFGIITGIAGIIFVLKKNLTYYH